MIYATRYHDFSYGHRVAGHENKCALLHGHNGRAVFQCAAEQLDHVGRVIDFSAIKATLCQWLENNWDHKFLAWDSDPKMRSMVNRAGDALWEDSLVWVPFNPTAENMAEHLLRVVGPAVLPPEIKLMRVELWETRKCSAIVEIKHD